ncbi:MAG: PilZ domain-containing protein [Bdellovibrionales bacterium]
MAEGQKKEGNATQNRPSGRKYTRISTHVAHDLAQSFMDVGLEWGNGEKTKIVDLSYRGAAAEVPEHVSLQACQSYPVHIQFSNQDVCEAQVEVMWIKNGLVGLYFEDMDAKAHLLFEKYLKDKLVGAHLRKIEPKYYSHQLTCTYWYQGPSDLQVYLWLNDSKLLVTQVIVLLDDCSFSYNDGDIKVGGVAESSQVQNLYSEGDLSSQKPPEKTDTEILTRVLSVLVQLHTLETELAPVFDTIVERLNEAPSLKQESKNG